MNIMKFVGAQILFIALSHVAAAQPIDVNLYAWQFPNVVNVNTESALVTVLRDEVSQILAAGHLAPLPVRYGDLPWEAYFIYQEPGRIITTLGWAFPYLTNAQKDSVRDYVAAELANANYAPWGNYPLSRTDGSRREYYPQSPIWLADHWMGNFRPKLHTIYGLWLFAERADEYEMLAPYWSAIEAFYNSAADEGRIYGSASGHVGMLRLAEQFGDTATKNEAYANLVTDLTDGLSFSSVETFLQNGYNGWDAPYGLAYDPRNDSLIYHGWMFLNMSPEIGRYLRGYHLAESTSRNTWATNRFHLWWLCAAQYFCRWTGDESAGLTPEIFGMVVPVERWTIGVNETDIARYFRSAPWGRGDCYWLEGLVQAIEATGDTLWRDVRSVPGVVDLTIESVGSDVILRWTSTGAASYLVEVADSANGTYQEYTTAFADSLVLTNEATTWPRRFYRVIAEP
jgi:hypothetical protein